MYLATRLLTAFAVVLLPATAQVNVLTWHNDGARTGANLAETVLTPSTVKSATFGKIGFLATDGKVDATPLIVSNLAIPGRGTHNVLYVATEHDSLYAADASTGALLWKVSVLKTGENPSDSRGCRLVIPEIGITATPVIDLTSGPHGTLYLVAATEDNSGGHHHRLHALDITTGAEEFGGPTEIQGQFPGTGAGSSGGTVTFDSLAYLERAALLLANGVVYTTWGSHCDHPEFTGWIMGYDEATLAQKYVLNVTPNGTDGGMWGSGAGPSVGPAGAIYTLVGNGTFDTALNSKSFPSQGDFGNAFLEMFPVNGVLQVIDYFTMSNTVGETDNDEDLGSGGSIVIPPLTDLGGQTHYLVVGAGKDQTLYLCDRRNMGKFNASQDQIYQELPGALPGGMWSAPAYFGGVLYFGARGDHIRAFQFQNAKLLLNPVSMTLTTFKYPGATPSISANGSSNGIVWATENVNPAILHAFEATGLTELYNSNQAGTRDHFGAANKFITPVIANGKVYVASQTGVGIFGLLP